MHGYDVCVPSFTYFRQMSGRICHFVLFHSVKKSCSSNIQSKNLRFHEKKFDSFNFSAQNIVDCGYTLEARQF